MTIPSPPTEARVLRFDGFRRTVGDLSRAIDFYCGALGFKLQRNHPCEVLATGAAGEAAPPARCAVLSLGDEAIELYAPVGLERYAHAEASACGIACVGFQHLAIVAGDMAEAFHRLQRFSPSAISTGGPVRLPASAGGVTAWKFRDTDGHPLELISLPAGTGDPKWRGAGSKRATLGIDHSAIAVANVERSLAFYVGALGFHLAARQTNRGAQQEALDGEAGADVEVVALNPCGSSTPHLELLGYRTPQPQPRRTWAPDLDTLSDRLAWRVEGMAAPHSPCERALCDPDGHVVVLRQHVLHS